MPWYYAGYIASPVVSIALNRPWPATSAVFLAAEAIGRQWDAIEADRNRFRNVRAFGAKENRS